MNLKGKSAIVTAAASGVGKTIAELLARQGVSVAIADVSQDAAQSVANAIESAGGKAISVAMDVTSEIHSKKRLRRTSSGLCGHGAGAAGGRRARVLPGGRLPRPGARGHSPELGR